MYVCHYCHGYADHLDGFMYLVQGLSSRVPPVANTLLNYCFLSYGTVKTDAGGYHIGHILIGLERIYGERQVI